MEAISDFLFDGTGWLIIAIILIGLEFLAPGIYFMWVGFAALVVSGVTFIFPDISWVIQILIFSGLAVVSVLVGRKYIMEKEQSSDDTTLNRRGAQYVGKKCEVVVAFKNGKGKIKVEDTLWTATGDKDFKMGASVKIVSQDGTRFVVEAVK
jgi:membrane protein implicated in regulation of membrane protease activity